MESAFELEFAFNFIILRNAMGERGINYTISNVMQAFGQVSPDPDDDKCLDTFLYLPVSVCPRRLPDLGGGGGRSKGQHSLHNAGVRVAQHRGAGQELGIAERSH